MADVTFRDFAGAVMTNNDVAAARVLEQLLALSPDAASAATAHFRTRMPDPAFMPKAMGLRTAVATGTDVEIAALLADCFGIADATASIAALRPR